MQHNADCRHVLAAELPHQHAQPPGGMHTAAYEMCWVAHALTLLCTIVPACLQSSRTSTRNRLAAAMGWTSLLQPFRALAGGSSSGRSGRDSSNQAQRRYLQVWRQNKGKHVVL